MCGIVGYYQNTERIENTRTIERMLTAIHHRGPDAENIFMRDSVILGNSRLSIIDLSANAHLPIISTTGKAVLAYNGEVYNFRQLGNELERAGVVFRSTSDSEVVLHALHFWGVEEAVQRFHGMFAFAYYDLSTQSLFLARDPLGIKPMYIAHHPDVCVFASEIKALFHHPSISAQVDPLAIASYMSQQHFGEAQTPFAGIEPVLPGHIHTLRGTTHKRIQYFDVEQLISEKDHAPLKSSREWYNEVERLLHSSIDAHLVSDAPVAVLCSGGLDSSYVTAVANQLHPAITAYVANVEGAKPEVKRAQRVCLHVGANLRTVTITNRDFLRAWPEVIWWNDVPSTFGSDIPFYLVARQCRADGVKAVLSGEGADELFCGYPWLWQAEYLLHAPTLMRTLTTFLRPFRDHIWPWLTDLDQRTRERMAFSTIEAPDPYQVLRDALTFNGGRSFARQTRLLRALQGQYGLVERVIRAACLNTLNSHLAALLHRADRMGMGASIECRVPYLYPPLMECAFSMPLSLRYHNGMGKRVLKEIALKNLPRDIVFAPKWGFSVSREPYRYARDLLRNGTTQEILKWSNQTTNIIIEELGNEHKPTILYTLISLELWGRIFLRGETPAGLAEQLEYLGNAAMQ